MKISVLLLFNFIGAFVYAQSNFSITVNNDLPEIHSPDFNGPDNTLIQYTGRTQRLQSTVRFWQPGAYLKVAFAGTSCKFFLNDEVLYGNQNYLAVIIDNQKPQRIQTTGHNNTITITGLQNGDHIITICKDTEAGIGYIEFAGISCKAILELPARPKRKIEFIGNSITCGMGMDTTVVACKKGKWFDQHNAYESYGPVTSRALNAEWQLSAVSGIGLIHSCCGHKITMPQVYNKISMNDDTLLWNFNSYIPDVVTICLGQNDGVQDSTTFCNAYIEFIETIRKNYPVADIVCLTSPMADETLTKVLKNYLHSVKEYLNRAGDKKVHEYFFSKRYFNGCDGHPSMSEHQQIAKELTRFIKQIKKW